MAFAGFAFSGSESQGGTTQFSGNIDLMAGPRATPKQCRSAWNRATHGHITDEPFPSGEIAARENGLLLIRRFGHCVEEVIHPAIRRPFRETNGREAESRRSAHGGDIAEAAGQRNPANVSRFVGSAPEMGAFRKKVGCKKQIIGAAARTINGAIIADSSHNRGTRRDFDQLFQVFGEGAFVSQNGGSNAYSIIARSVLLETS